ncbi:MAG: M23 family metallopeptidase [Candidatus Faecenecus gallistercoris]|nr:M23 family metallopeptidase [Bacillota bacterium]MDD7102978.1 M23 family metallopeptidase [Bacillota bacterium]MDY4051390.1 M23 family metallopeptidase [Candidatus Faecenecus gallistercoris]
MDNYEKYKKAYYKKHHLVKRKYKFVNKLLVLGILFVGVLITVKVNPTAANWVKTHVYMDNFSFAQIENWYNKYIGGIFSSNDDEVTQVFSGTIPYTSLEPYYDGVRLKVSSGSVVESLLSGIIVSIGETVHYGNTIVVEQVDGVSVWYGNVDVSDVKLYDYVEKGQILGMSRSEDLYLVLMKDGAYLNYQDYVA